jgi:DNA-directed RNA polymerase subunit RPC12/RpoP
LVKATAQTLVVVCSRCGGLLLAKADQKTRSCPHCGFTIFLQKAKKLASASTANEASVILRRLKTEAATEERGL